jgi:hypothetical protein
MGLIITHKSACILLTATTTMTLARDYQLTLLAE